MGTDPHSFTRPKTIGDRSPRAAERGRPDERCRRQAAPRRPRSRTEELASAGAGRHRLAVGFARTSPSPLGYWFVAGHALERDCGLRDRAAQGKARTRREGWPGAIADELRDHCHPARVYRSRVAQPARQAEKPRARVEDLALREPDDRAWRWGSLGALDEALKRLARRSRLRRSTSWRARKAYTSLRSGLSPRAKSLSSARRRTATRMRSARAGRSSPAPSSSKTSRISWAPSVEMPVTVMALRFAPPSLMAPSSGTRTRSRMGRGVHCRLARDFVAGLPSWRRMGRARPVDVDAVDRQRRGGASACDEPGAEAEEGGSRTHAEQRCSDSAEDSAEDSDQQSAGLRRLAVGRDRTRDPARHNSQDHPSRRNPLRLHFR